MKAYPRGVTPTPPSGSPNAESKPEDIRIAYGLKALIFGNKKVSQAYT